jgi:hypothetical protein
MIEGLMIVLSGFSLKNAFSPNSFVLQLQISHSPLFAEDEGLTA